MTGQKYCCLPAPLPAWLLTHTSSYSFSSSSWGGGRGGDTFDSVQDCWLTEWIAVTSSLQYEDLVKEQAGMSPCLDAVYCVFWLYLLRWVYEFECVCMYFADKATTMFSVGVGYCRKLTHQYSHTHQGPPIPSTPPSSPLLSHSPLFQLPNYSALPYSPAFSFLLFLFISLSLSLSLSLFHCSILSLYLSLWFVKLSVLFCDIWYTVWLHA